MRRLNHVVGPSGRAAEIDDKVIESLLYIGILKHRETTREFDIFVMNEKVPNADD